MPFKTRHRKESAISRRFAYIEAASHLAYNSSKEASEKKAAGVSTKKIKSTEAVEDFFFVRRDLVKIVLVSASILIIQLAFFYSNKLGLFHFY